MFAALKREYKNSIHDTELYPERENTITLEICDDDEAASGQIIKFDPNDPELIAAVREEDGEAT